MNTVVTEILNHCNKLISEGYQIDTQGIVHWIEDKLLDMEKEQIRDATLYGWRRSTEANSMHPDEYYNQTFKSE